MSKTVRNPWMTRFAALAIALAPAAWAQEKTQQPAGEAKPAPEAKPAAETAKPKEQAPATGARIEFEKETIDLGDIIKGEKAQFVFGFKNSGTADLEIKEAKPSCGCTVAEYTRTVKPGETGKVQAAVDTSRFKGPITKTVTVTSNDPVHGTIHLQAKGNVRALIDVGPSENVYFRVFRNDTQPSKRVLTVTANAENTFKISKVESSNPAVTTNLVDLGKSDKDEAKGANYQLEVDVKKDAPIGPVTGVITVTTTHPKVPTLTLNVNGQVLGDVLVTPQKVYLGQVTKETAPAIKRTVRIERRAGTDFKIEKVESTNPAIKAEMAAVEEGKVYTVTISVGSDLPAGAINANVLVKTNDKGQPTIEIPVIGTVQG